MSDLVYQRDNRKSIYVSTDLFHALWVLAKADKVQLPDGTRIATPDEVANQMLRETLKQRYPQLLEHQAKVAKMETELVKSLTREVT